MQTELQAFTFNLLLYLCLCTHNTRARTNTPASLIFTSTPRSGTAKERINQLTNSSRIIYLSPLHLSLSPTSSTSLFLFFPLVACSPPRSSTTSSSASSSMSSDSPSSPAGLNAGPSSSSYAKTAQIITNHYKI